MHKFFFTMTVDLSPTYLRNETGQFLQVLLKKLVPVSSVSTSKFKTDMLHL